MSPPHLTIETINEPAKKERQTTMVKEGIQIKKCLKCGCHFATKPGDEFTRVAPNQLQQKVDQLRAAGLNVIMINKVNQFCALCCSENSENYEDS